MTKAVSEELLSTCKLSVISGNENLFSSPPPKSKEIIYIGIFTSMAVVKGHRLNLSGAGAS